MRWYLCHSRLCSSRSRYKYVVRTIENEHVSTHHNVSNSFPCYLLSFISRYVWLFYNGFNDDDNDNIRSVCDFNCNRRFVTLFSIWDLYLVEVDPNSFIFDTFQRVDGWRFWWLSQECSIYISYCFCLHLSLSLSPSVKCLFKWWAFI